MLTDEEIVKAVSIDESRKEFGKEAVQGVHSTLLPAIRDSIERQKSASANVIIEVEQYILKIGLFILMIYFD